MTRFLPSPFALGGELGPCQDRTNRLAKGVAIGPKLQNADLADDEKPLVFNCR